MDRPVRGDVVLMGEVGLTGEVRAVIGVEARVKEAAALGFREAVVPKSNVADGAKLALPVHGVASVHEAIDALLG
jgi:DNA repair protein RadA/Sms